MKLLDLTLPTPEENLALDEALLDEAEEQPHATEVLRLWESPQHAVIIGRSSQAEGEVNLGWCRGAGVPVLRRCSGGAAVVIGPGCLMYAVVLDCDLRPQLRMVDQAHRFVLDRLVRALRQLAVPAEFHEPCDVTIADRKISGNSMRTKRRALLYHGTILYGFPSEFMETCLFSPPRQPAYRVGRTHADFVSNVPLSGAALRGELVRVWEADEPLLEWPRERVRQLARDRYARDEWNFRI